MKLIALFFVSLITMFVLSGCQSRKAEKKAYIEEGKMDEQVQSWDKSGSRFK